MDIIWQGLVLMGFGMGFVFAFLALLILVTNFSMKGVARFDSIIPQEAPKKPAAKPTGSDDANVALAIAVALG